MAVCRVKDNSDAFVAELSEYAQKLVHSQIEVAFQAQRDSPRAEARPASAGDAAYADLEAKPLFGADDDPVSGCVDDSVIEPSCRRAIRLSLNNLETAFRYVRS